jgi:hypothetical protein
MYFLPECFFYRQLPYKLELGIRKDINHYESDSCCP